MAEILVGLTIAIAGERTASRLIKILALTDKVESQIESIDRELGQIYAFLRHVERKEEEGQGDQDINEWATKAKDLALDAEHIIDTFMIESVKRRKRRSIFFWIDERKVDKELQRIRKQLADISNTGKNYARTNTGNLIETSRRVSVERTTIEKVASAVDDFNNILSQNLLTRHKATKLVEQVRHEFVTMQDVLTNLKTTEESSERQKILKKQVEDICDFTEDVVRNFTNRRQVSRRMRRSKRLLFPFGGCISEKNFEKKMRRIKTQMQGAYDRRWTYGIGEYVDGWEGIRPMVPRKKLWPRKILRVLLTTLWIFFFLLYMSSSALLYALPLCPIALVVGAQVVTLWQSVNKNLELIRCHSNLMHALFKDVEGVQDLNERQKAWIEQLQDLAQHVEALVAEYEDERERPREGGFARRLVKNVVHRPKLARDINRMLHKVGDLLERKKDYGIKTIVGRRVPFPVDQNMQGTEINSMPHTAEERPPAPLQIRNSHQPVTGFKEKVESLRGHLQLMNALFRDVRNMENLDRKARAWLEQMRQIAPEAQSFIDAYDNSVEDGRINICNYFTPTREIKRIIKKIEGALRGQKSFGLEQQTGAEPFSTVQRRQPSLIVKESSTIGLDDDVEVLREQLVSDEVCLCVTSIVGIRGTGKKTLARLIYNDVSVKKQFYYRVWVSMPQNYNFELLLEEIAKQIPEVQGLKWTSEEELICILGTSLAEKRYLIVVDGVQTSQVWDSLKKALPDTSMGSRVLLTSRNINVALHITGPTSSFHPLQLLDDEDSWVLFRKRMVTTDDEVRKLGEKIVIKCGGLPSEIIKMANLLSHTDVSKEEWSREPEQLKQDPKPWLETLNMFDKGDMHLQRCLFYFVLFPADFKIPARRLIALWVAEGLVRHKDQNRESPEYVAERYLAQLIDRNMVQVTKRKHNGKVKTCRLPNALRDIWLKKAEDYKFGHSGAPSTASIRRLADHLHSNDASYDHIHGANRSTSASLRTCYKDVLSFLSFDAREGSKPGEDAGNFLSRCISIKCLLLLRVLDLEHVYKPKLPKEIGKLRRLSYLGLRWTYLESLPSSISKLLRLQMLDLKHTYISTLPRSIWEMELRHLYLSETYRTKFPSQRRSGPGYLTDLQTLWGLFVDEKCPVKGGLDKLVNLKKLGLACQPMSSQQQAMESQLEAIADWLLKLKDLRSLRLKSRDEQGQPWNLHLKPLSDLACLTDMYLLGKLSSSSSIWSLFPPSLVELTLSHSGLSEDPMQILNDLPNLRSLHLSAESYNGKNMLCKSGSFPQLRVLKIWKLAELEEWDIEQGALPNLRQLEIRSCGRLKMPPGGMKYIESQLELKLTDMPNVCTVSP